VTYLVLAFAVVMASLGVRGLWHLARGLQEGRSSREWPTAEGEILQAEYRYRWWLNVYRVTLGYRYLVGGVSYVGDRVRVDWDWNRDFWIRKTAEQVVTRYHGGSRVAVHYDPARPQSAVLEAGSDPRLPLKFLIEVAYTSFAVWLALAMLR
jgi:hypothetical protein